MINKNDITAVVVSYYRGDRLKICLESLVVLEFCGGELKEISKLELMKRVDL